MLWLLNEVDTGINSGIEQIYLVYTVKAYTSSPNSAKEVLKRRALSQTRMNSN